MQPKRKIIDWNKRKGYADMSIRRTVNLTGINSSEIYTLNYPQSVLKFADYDFSGFIKRCTDYCKRCMTNGEYRLEDIVALRNSLGACHKYVEANIHGIYEKVVQDLFIEYLCREKGLGISSLWNELINAKNPFDKLIFTRLTEYRHNKAVNRWVSLLQLQDYAKKKIDFVFGEKATLEQAYAKRDYFDLTFSVAANEMGYPTECFTAAKVYTVGRLPSAPFITSNISKAIAGSALPDIDYDDMVHRPFSPMHSDSEAMDVFAKVKNYIPEKPDSVLNTIITTMRSLPKKVYVSDSFKAVIDLEIDLLLESGGILQRCARCGEYYLRDKDYDYDYCDKAQPGGRTCLELSTTTPPRTADEIRQLEDMTKELYTYMSKRINVDLTQRDFAEWYQSFMAIKESILHNTLSVAEFREFENYSHDLHFAPVKPPEPPAEKQPEQASDDKQNNTQKQPEVKPFVFERVDRSVLYEQEKRRRKQEQERELLEREQERMSSQPPEPITDAVPKQPVHVMKAEEAESLDVTVFDNPFDGAFDEEISKLENVTANHDFKPLDDIFSFGSSDEPETSVPHPDENRAPDSDAYEKNSYDKENSSAIDTGFAGEFAKADYSIRKTATPKSNYAANMYRHTIETTQSDQSDDLTELYPEIRSDGERLTTDDFDILPSSPVPEVSEKAEKPAVTELPKPKRTTQGHAAPVIKLDAPSIDDLTDSEDIPGSDRRRRSDSAVSRNTAKRLLDGIIKPTKIRNPFIDENDDE